MKRLSIALAFTLAGLSVAHAADAGADAAANPSGFEPITPYRPSVSSPAQLPAPGQLELELGGLHQRSDDFRRDSLPYALKLAFTNEWGLVIGGEALVRSRDDTGRASGIGDTTLLLKRAWLVDDATAFGMELAAKLPTAKDEIGSGHADYELNTIFSRDIGPVHLDANLNATRLGLADPGTGRTQLGASASFSGALSGHWGLTGELSGTHRSGTDNGTQVLAALTYSPSKFLTFDIGAARAFRPTPGTTQLFAGVVFPIAKFW
jgi:hypothetical protein